MILAPLGLFPIILIAFTPNITRTKHYVTLALAALGALIVLLQILAVVLALYFCLRVGRIKSFYDTDIPGQYFKIAADEITNKKTINELYAKSYAMADGNLNKCNALYVKTRARQLYQSKCTEKEVVRLKSEIVTVNFLEKLKSFVSDSFYIFPLVLISLISIVIFTSIPSIISRRMDFIQWMIAWNDIAFEWLWESCAPSPQSPYRVQVFLNLVFLLFKLISYSQIFITSALPFFMASGCLKIRNARINKTLSKASN